VTVYGQLPVELPRFQRVGSTWSRFHFRDRGCSAQVGQLVRQPHSPQGVISTHVVMEKRSDHVQTDDEIADRRHGLVNFLYALGERFVCTDQRWQLKAEEWNCLASLCTRIRQ
jgi:hypothetical protein